MKTIVISGINLISGGTLSIYKACLSELVDQKYYENYNIIALVHSKELFTEFSNNINFIEFSKAKKNWLNRLFYEYIFFYFWSKKRKIDLWFSIHDITPTVKAKKRVVYCHNSTPFYKMKLSQIKYGWKEFLFSKFYKFLYKINIKKNDYVIVQQDWIREGFKKLYNIDNIIVARPSVKLKELLGKNNKTGKNVTHTFIFASLSRFFKNFEVICEASKILIEKNIIDFKVVLTIDGTENRYSKDLIRKYGNISNIDFVGLLKKSELLNYYNNADTMIFPSLLETWGLPITEFKELDKPIILADLPYAHETIGTYDKVCFFDPNDAKQLADLMEKDINKINIYKSVKCKSNGYLYTNTWQELWSFLLK